jgi:hypothetical protein
MADNRLMAVAIPIDVVQQVICDIKGMGAKAPLSFKRLWVYLDPTREDENAAGEEGGPEGPEDAEVRRLQDFYAPHPVSERGLERQLTLWDVSE